MTRKWLSILLVAACGCVSDPAAAPPAQQRGPAGGTVVSATARPASEQQTKNLSVLPHDGPLVAQMDVYQLSVPFGAVSRSDEFWKRIDETKLDVATYDLLVRNGVRIGIGANVDWKYFKELIDQYKANCQRGVAGVTQSGSLELVMRSAIDSQDLFYFDSKNTLWGRTFEQCDNLLALSFFPHPRFEGDTVIELCPIVRGLRRQFTFTVLNEEREIELKRPEQLFDLRAKAQVAVDHFLVVGPSRISELPASLGSTFLVKPGAAEPMETILILVPRAFRVGEDSLAVPVRPKR